MAIYASFLLQLRSLQYLDLQDETSSCDFTISNDTIDLLLSSICVRFTKLMVLQHSLQDYMSDVNFDTSNDTLIANAIRALEHIQTAASRLQDIQVSAFKQYRVITICTYNCVETAYKWKVRGVHTNAVPMHF